MARKQAIAIQDNIETTEQLLDYIKDHEDKLICMEIYSDFCGQCVPMLATIRKIKMEVGSEKLSMAKKGQVTRVMYGADGIRLNEIVAEELALEEKEKTSDFVRPKFGFTDHTPEEKKYAEMEEKHQNKVLAEQKRIKKERQAARKQRVCERLAVQTPILNYILFFPHCHQAHYDLYEKWDPLNLSVFGKEEVHLTEEIIPEAFYLSDIDLNEACIHELLNGPVLIILFKAMETDTRDIVRLMRYVLYEEIHEIDPENPPEEQPPQMTAYQMYGIISKTREEVVYERWEKQQELKKTQHEERKRIHKESTRLALEAEEEKKLLEKRRAEEEKIARLQAGVGGAAKEPESEPEPETKPEQTGEEEAVEEEKTEEHVKQEQDEDERSGEELEEFDYEKENDEEEYIPPGNLFVPGFYSPPNHLARANGLALFFPKLIEKFARIESEFLPPHLLMLYPIDKRHEVQEAIKEFKNEILQVGIFSGLPAEKPKFVAYSVKQYDKMRTLPDPKECMALMVSRKHSLPLLTLAGLGPIHISTDVKKGEAECAELFPVGYGDDFEEVESIVEEEEIEEEEEIMSPD